MRHIYIIALLALLLPLAQAHGDVVIADLASDFSTTSNPNPGAYGTWSYNNGSAANPYYYNGNWAGNSALSGWGPPTNTPNAYLPFFT